MSHSTITFDLGALVQPRINDIVESCNAIFHLILFLRCLGNCTPVEACLETVDCRHQFVSIPYNKIHSQEIDATVCNACSKIKQTLEKESVPIAQITVDFYKRSNIAQLQSKKESPSWTSWLTRSFKQETGGAKELDGFQTNAAPLERWKLAVYVDTRLSNLRQTPSMILQNIVHHANNESDHLPALNIASQSDTITYPFQIKVVSSSSSNETVSLANAPSVLMGTKRMLHQHNDMLRRSDSDSITITRSKPIDIVSGRAVKTNGNGSSSPNSPGSGSSKWQDGINVLREVIVNVPLGTGSSL